MLPGSVRNLGGTVENKNPLELSWHDSAWIPILNGSNVMDYFSQRTNPFYARTCNNETIKMQRLSPDHLRSMTGLEYVLLHAQEPILYVVRKQHRHSPTKITPLADYYIDAGIVYQAPDLASVVGSRLLSTVSHLQSSFEEASSYTRYHPSNGYSWDFRSQRGDTDKVKVRKEKPKEEPVTPFQRQRVGMLLTELVKKFPFPSSSHQSEATPGVAAKKSGSGNGSAEIKEIKTKLDQEEIKPPQKKRRKLNSN